MKKVFYSVAALGFCLSMVSFKSNESKIPNYLEVSQNSIYVKMGKFTKYQESRFTPGKGEWYYRNEATSLSNNGNGLKNIEMVLKNN